MVATLALNKLSTNFLLFQWFLVWQIPFVYFTNWSVKFQNICRRIELLPAFKFIIEYRNELEIGF